MVSFNLLVLMLLLAQQPAAAADTEVEHALAQARTRAAAGDVIAQFSLGALMYFGGTDTAGAVSWIRQAAAQHYAPAEFQMGQMYDFGFGVPQDDGEALAWYRKAADHGSAPAERSIGEFYK